MAEKRKDNKGRVLKDGESQRKNGSYEYRYSDIRKKRHSVYAKSLAELREKERGIQRDLDDGIDYAAGRITVFELVERYLSQRRPEKHSTAVNYNFVKNLLKKEKFCGRKIDTVKPSDGKAFFLKLHDDGYSFSTIHTVRSVLKPAFELAVEDDAVRRNPFAFTLNGVISNDSEKRKALSAEEKKRLLTFLENDECGRKYYDVVVILLGTGLRISELCGLTKADVNFEAGRIQVNKQLLRGRMSGVSRLILETPKSQCGVRYIPMLDRAVIEAFHRVIQARESPKVEHIVGGYSGFLFLDKNGTPKTAVAFEHALCRLMRKYNQLYDDVLKVTPHILRHTFCTELISAGMEISSVSYLMGHSNASTTLGVYTHGQYETAEKAFAGIVENRALS